MVPSSGTLTEGTWEDGSPRWASEALLSTDPSYDKWEIENSVIMAWLINSIVPEIGKSFY